MLLDYTESMEPSLSFSRQFLSPEGRAAISATEMPQNSKVILRGNETVCDLQLGLTDYYLLVVVLLLLLRWHGGHAPESLFFLAWG